MAASDKKHNVRLGQTVVVFCFAMLATHMAFGQSAPACPSVSSPNPGQIATIVTQPVDYYFSGGDALAAQAIFAALSDQTGIQIEFLGVECYSLDATASHTWSFQVPNASQVALRIEGSLTPGSLLSYIQILNDGTPETRTISAAQLEAQGGEWEAGIAINDTVYLMLTGGAAPLAAPPELKVKLKVKGPAPFLDGIISQESKLNNGPFTPIQDATAQQQTNAAPVFKVVFGLTFSSPTPIGNIKNTFIKDLIQNGANSSCTGWNTVSAGANRNWAFTNWHCAPGKQGGKMFTDTVKDSDGTDIILNFIASGSTADYDFLYRYQDGPPRGTADQNLVKVHGADMRAINADLDFTMLKISDNSKPATNAVAPINVNGCTKNNEAHIPQHPGGQPKSVVAYTDAGKTIFGKITDVGSPIVSYNLNTLGGSSGSPVYENTSNMVCALHFGTTDLGVVNQGTNLKDIMNFTPAGGMTIKQILGLK